MKIKVLCLFPSALFLMLGVFFAPALTQPTLANTAPIEIAQAQTPNINLTDAQKAQIQKLRESVNKEIDTVFTPDQKAKILEARKTKQKPNITLSADQQKKMKSIFENYQAQVEKILTPAQIQELKKAAAAGSQKPK